MTSQPEPPPLETRVIELETHFTMLHRTVEELNQVILEQHQRQDALQQRLARLELLLQRIVEGQDAEADEGPD